MNRGKAFLKRLIKRIPMSQSLIEKVFLKRLYKRIKTSQSLIEKAAWFVACEKIEGDYLEFGTYQGWSFISAYKALDQAFKIRTNFTTGLSEENDDNIERSKIWSNMRFIGFDSFKGLPRLTTEDRGTEDFKEGMYSCSEDKFIQNITKDNVPLNKVITIKGYFEDTCKSEIINQYKIKKASIIFIDCDLYSSARIALNFVSNLLQDGTVIIFDDWYTNKGSPYKGEQKAFYEWTNKSNMNKLYQLSQYQKEGWARNSFIVSTKT